MKLLRTLATILMLVMLLTIEGVLSKPASAFCNAGSDNFGPVRGMRCRVDPSCGSYSICETEWCSQSACGSGGYLEYCIGSEYCGLYPGCNRC